MISSITFRNFKALRSAKLSLGPFNLVVGANGSGKTSLIQALLLLRGLTKLPIKDAHGTTPPIASPEIDFTFDPPFAGLEVQMACSSDFICDLLKVRSASPGLWEQAKKEILRIRSYLFDHYAMGAPAALESGGELSGNGGNLAAVLARWHREKPELFSRLEREFCRMLNEFAGLEVVMAGDGRVSLAGRLNEQQERVAAENMSQGTLYTLGILVLAFEPQPPAIVCVEEIDRGIHPRLLRDVRDAFYRLSHPSAYGEARAPVQIVATTHSPYLLDLFKDHPDEVVIAQKDGREAHFERLVERPDYQELLSEGSLGDLWFSGILGGVPREKLTEDDR